MGSLGKFSQPKGFKGKGKEQLFVGSEYGSILKSSDSQNSSLNDHSNLSFIDMYGDVRSSHTTNDSSIPLENSQKQKERARQSLELKKPDINSSTDRYGFKKTSNHISEQRYNEWWSDYAPHCYRRKTKWVQFLTKNGLPLNNDNPQRFPPRSEKLKRYIRKGIPAEWRGNAWWYFAKGSQYLQVGVYDQLVESTLNLTNKDSDIIERDLHRTFPDNIYFKSNAQTGEESILISSLRRVLKCFAMYQPSIGYCQSLNFICGLLLIFFDEEKAFWMLFIITTKYLPKVHEINLEGVNIDQGVLMLALRHFIPDVWDKISNMDLEDANINHKDIKKRKKKNQEQNQEFLQRLPPITLCTSSWFMSCFISVLPIESALRVWDCFLYEGSNFLFKTSLSIFKLLEPQILMISDEMEIFQIVQNFPKSMIDPSTLFDVIFKRRLGFNHLNQEEIDRCKKYVSEERKRGIPMNLKDLNELNNRGLLDEALWQPDLYGFKKNGLPGVHWNNTLTKKMKSSIRRRS